jgi:hypothetical protein
LCFSIVSSRRSPADVGPRFRKELWIFKLEGFYGAAAAASPRLVPLVIGPKLPVVVNHVDVVNDRVYVIGQVGLDEIAGICSFEISLKGEVEEIQIWRMASPDLVSGISLCLPNAVIACC